MTTVAATEPHLVLLGGDELGVPPKTVEAGLRRLGVHCRILVVSDQCPNDDRLDAIWFTLEALPRDYLTMDVDSQNYSILASPACGLPAPSTPEDSHGKQANRFLALLECGTRHHRLACAYHRAAVRSHRSCEREWTIGAIIGGPFSLLWRTQLSRYLATLAHYLPGVDVQCVPLPHPPANPFDSVQNPFSAEGWYAFSALCAFGLHKPFANELQKLLAVDGDPETHSLPSIAGLAGWTTFFQRIACAHIRVMGATLTSDSSQLLSLKTNRHTCNQHRLFCRVWGLPMFVEAPEALADLVDEFRAGRRAHDIKPFVSFRKFITRDTREDGRLSPNSKN